MSFETNYDFLANETIKLGEQIQQERVNNSLSPESQNIEASFFSDILSISENQKNSIVSETTHSNEEFLEEGVDLGPGLLLRLEKGANTFCIRAFATDDIQEVFDLVQIKDKSLCKPLRIDWENFQKDLLVFSTETFSEAEILMDQLANRRYPLKEEVLCNLSDPGFSWWMDDGEGYLQIFFQSHGIERAENFIRLGPISDSLMACKRFNQMMPYLRKHMAINEFSVSEKSFGIRSSNAKDPIFKTFKELFLTGEVGLKEELFPQDNEGRTLSLYFQELALVRRFWCFIEERLSKY